MSPEKEQRMIDLLVGVSSAAELAELYALLQHESLDCAWHYEQQDDRGTASYYQTRADVWGTAAHMARGLASR